MESSVGGAPPAPAGVRGRTAPSYRPPGVVPPRAAWAAASNMLKGSSEVSSVAAVVVAFVDVWAGGEVVCAAGLDGADVACSRCRWSGMPFNKVRDV